MNDATHPSPQQLLAFATGRLGRVDAETIEGHLPGCPQCLADLERVAGETAVGGSIVAALRAAEHATPPPEPEPAYAPRELREHPRYQIAGRLGSGGMGAVYHAEHRLLERPVVIKVIRPDLLHRPGLADRFLREARLAARLSHPNIVTVHEAEQVGRLVLLVMEYVAGETFSEVVRKRGPAPVKVACELVRQAALGLQHIHEQKLVHRDVKPSNLMLTPGGEVKVLDLGLAFLKTEDDAGAAELTRPEQSMGTVDYTAPEQWENSHGVDIRADVYSLGCTFYYLLTATPPFAGAGEAMPNLMRQIWAHSLAPVPNVRDVRPDIPQAVADVVTRMLAKKPADRFNVPGDVAAALAPLAAGADAATYLAGGQSVVRDVRPALPSDVSPVSTTADAPRRVSRRAAIFGLTAAAVAAAGGGYAWHRASAGGAGGLASVKGPPAAPSGPPIKVGVLHSLSGTMSISERPVVDAVQLAVDELNAAGGLLGRPVLAVVVDGASDESVFADGAERLINQDKVCVVFGCWTSASRRTVRPIFEKYDHLLFYPVQYEGLEQSPNIVYTGAAPNQQILPAVRWCTTLLGKRRLFLVGSDYVFPRCANAIVRDRAKTLSAQVVGEEYLPLGSQDFGAITERIAAAKPDLILNTINGDSNVGFYRALRNVRKSADEMPVMSFSIAEEELSSLRLADMTGDFAAWNYFMSVQRPENQAFIGAFRARYGGHRVLTDPMESAYTAVHLWAQTVVAAGTPDTAAVRRHVGGQTYDAPGGPATVDPKTQHTSKVVRVGKIVDTTTFEVVYTSENPVIAEPYPATRTPAEWQAFVDNLYAGWGGHWSKQGA